MDETVGGDDALAQSHSTRLPGSGPVRCEWPQHGVVKMRPRAKGLLASGERSVPAMGAQRFLFRGGDIHLMMEIGWPSGDRFIHQGAR
jgi:hypothetical protein